jgi:hypothetical protein
MVLQAVFYKIFVIYGQQLGLKAAFDYSPQIAGNAP